MYSVMSESGLQDTSFFGVIKGSLSPIHAPCIVNIVNNQYSWLFGPYEIKFVTGILAACFLCD